MIKTRSSDADILAQLPAALERARSNRRTKPHAQAACIDKKTRSIVVRLSNGVVLSVPVALIPQFSNTTSAQLATVEVGHGGVGLHWESLDIDIGVSALAQLALGRRTLMHAAGAAGGASRSTSKKLASRENGKKGGRPRVR